MAHRTSQIPSGIFRAYDIRGIVEQELTVDRVYTLGLAIGNTAFEQGQTEIAVARDGRLSGPEFSQAMIQGILASGCNAIDLGMVPTPLLYFATNVLETHSGVMITGSHNPSNYNGFKLVIAGQTLYGPAIQNLYQRIVNNDLKIREPGLCKTYDIRERYLQTVIDQIHLNRSFKVVVDCGNGVTGELAPQLLTLLGCEVIPLFCDIDGHFPNHHPDPMDPKNLTTLINTVREQKADLGLAFDGDGDRLGLVTEQGDIIWPDRQLMLIATDMLRRYPGAGIVYDVKCTRLLTTLIREQGGQPLMSATGHSLIKAKLKETGAPLAGEMSGHIFFNDDWYGFDDALYAAARLLALLSTYQIAVGAVFAQFPQSVNTPELHIPIAENKKFALIQALQKNANFPDGEIITIDGLRVDFKAGWGLVRASNTTPCLVARFEADDVENLMRIQNLFRTQLLALDPELNLPF